jgi:hypothetical protein
LVYRFADGDIERFSLPKSAASDHTLQQSWYLALTETGEAAGTLDLYVTGGWVDILGLGTLQKAEDIVSLLKEKITFPLPGLSIAAKSMRQTSSGYRFTFDIQAQLGIVSGTDILMKQPGGVPDVFAQLPADGGGFSFKFPFVLEQNAVVITPPGYRALMLPGKSQTGDSKSSLDSSVVHWPKRRRAELSFKWTVRNAEADDFSAKTILEQARQALNWPRTSIPFRK